MPSCVKFCDVDVDSGRRLCIRYLPRTPPEYAPAEAHPGAPPSFEVRIPSRLIKEELVREWRSSW
jgi:hypothetical protein